MVRSKPASKIRKCADLLKSPIGKVLKQARDIRSFQEPSKRDYRSVRRWFWNVTPLVEKEREFIKHREDIITLHNGREWSTFDEIVEKLLMSLGSTVVWVRILSYVLRIIACAYPATLENVFDSGITKKD